MTIINFARELKGLLENYGLFTVVRDVSQEGMVLKVSLDGNVLFKITIENDKK